MSIADEIERLQSLRERGALSEQEFEHAKAQVLGQARAADTASAADMQPGTLPNLGGSFLHRLARSRSDRWLGGVCGGLGRHSELPSWAWRLIFCVVTLYFGAGLLLYLLLWALLPLEPAAAS